MSLADEVAHGFIQHQHHVVPVQAGSVVVFLRSHGDEAETAKETGCVLRRVQMHRADRGIVHDFQDAPGQQQAAETLPVVFVAHHSEAKACLNGRAQPDAAAG